MSTISTTITNGVTLGTVSNPPTYASPLTITSVAAVETSGTAVYGPATAARTVVNQGTITATGVNSDGILLKHGGSVDNTELIAASGGVLTN